MLLPGRAMIEPRQEQEGGEPADHRYELLWEATRPWEGQAEAHATSCAQRSPFFFLHLRVLWHAQTRVDARKALGAISICTAVGESRTPFDDTMRDSTEALEEGLLPLLFDAFRDSPNATWVLTQFPANPVRQFQQLYCMWIALMLARNLRAHVKFLTWFDGSGLELSRKRGLGAHPSKIYGLFSPPTLTGAQLRLVGLALIGCLLAACAPVLPRVFLFLSYLLSLCYFPQLYAEVTCSGHSTILIPSILFILSCSSSLDHAVQSQHEWPLVLIRIYMASGYFSSGACKLLCGLRFNRYWGKGPTLQMYIFDSMWSRPAGPLVLALQKWLLKRPWLLTVLASGAVAFETGFILAPTSDTLCLLFGLNGIAFHLGIGLLQVHAYLAVASR